MWQICFPDGDEPPDDPFVRGGEWEFAKIVFRAFREPAIDDIEQFLLSIDLKNPEHTPRNIAILISDRCLEKGLAFCDDMTAAYHDEDGEDEVEDEMEEQALSRFDSGEQFLSPNLTPLDQRVNTDGNTAADKAGWG
jgi:hypothetical protein